MLAQRGELKAADALARDAVAIGDRSDFPNNRADTYLDLAQVLRITSTPDEALNAARRALELYEEKGNLVSADWARTLVDEIEGQLPNSIDPQS